MLVALRRRAARGEVDLDVLQDHPSQLVPEDAGRAGGRLDVRDAEVAEDHARPVVPSLEEEPDELGAVVEEVDPLPRAYPVCPPMSTRNGPGRAWWGAGPRSRPAPRRCRRACPSRTARRTRPRRPRPGRRRPRPRGPRRWWRRSCRRRPHGRPRSRARSPWRRPRSSGGSRSRSRLGRAARSKTRARSACRGGRSSSRRPAPCPRLQIAPGRVRITA